MTTPKNVSITITDDNGIQIDKTDEAVGIYRGDNPPLYLTSEPNVFIGENFTAAKRSALAYIVDIADQIADDVADLKSLRKQDMHWLQ